MSAILTQESLDRLLADREPIIRSHTFILGALAIAALGMKKQRYAVGLGGLLVADVLARKMVPAYRRFVEEKMYPGSTGSAQRTGAQEVSSGFAMTPICQSGYHKVPNQWGWTCAPDVALPSGCYPFPAGGDCLPSHDDMMGPNGSVICCPRGEPAPDPRGRTAPEEVAPAPVKLQVRAAPPKTSGLKPSEITVTPPALPPPLIHPNRTQMAQSILKTTPPANMTDRFAALKRF